MVTVRRNRRDRAARIPAAAMTGDPEGWARCTVTPHAGGSRATGEREADAGRPLMRRLAVPGRLVPRADTR